MCCGYDPGKHLALGHALAPLCDKGGVDCQNGLFLPQHVRNVFRWGVEGPVQGLRRLAGQRHGRARGLLHCRPAEIGVSLPPLARAHHPREDHLAPTWVAVGAAEDDNTTQTYHDKGLSGGVKVSSYRLG